MRIVLTKNIVKKTSFVTFPVPETQRNVASGQKLVRPSKIPSSGAGIALYARKHPAAPIQAVKIATRST